MHALIGYIGVFIVLPVIVLGSAFLGGLVFVSIFGKNILAVIGLIGGGYIGFKIMGKLTSWYDTFTIQK